MNLAELNKVAEAMVAPGKGILAADESSGTIKKRFDAIGVECTEDNRRDYREMMFRSAEGMKHISGVILYDETIWQKAKDGTPLVELIKKAGAIPGIKVDEGTKPLPNCPGELDHRRPRQARRPAAEILRAGRALREMARGDRHRRGHPELHRDPHQRARARALRRALPGGADRADRRAGSADGRRPRHRPLLSRSPNAVLKETVPGALLPARRARRHRAQAEHGGPRQEERQEGVGVEEVAEKTVKMLKDCVPGAVPGIAFLSGGQSDEEATAHLDAMNKIGDLPWKLTFSYGRALQAAPQKAWAGKAENVAAGQRAFAHRAKMNGLAALGQWKQDLEKAA